MVTSTERMNRSRVRDMSQRFITILLFVSAAMIGFAAWLFLSFELRRSPFIPFHGMPGDKGGLIVVRALKGSPNIDDIVIYDDSLGSEAMARVVRIEGTQVWLVAPSSPSYAMPWDAAVSDISGIVIFGVAKSRK